jgi:Sec-independent protein translocase protein TatA
MPHHRRAATRTGVFVEANRLDIGRTTTKHLVRAVSAPTIVRSADAGSVWNCADMGVLDHATERLLNTAVSSNGSSRGEGEAHHRGYGLRVPFDGAFSEMHWLIVALVALLVFPPNELPKLAERAGRFLRQLNDIRGSLRDELQAMIHALDEPEPSSGPPEVKSEGEELG